MEKVFLRQDQGRSIIPCEEAPVRPHVLRHIIEDGMFGHNDIDGWVLRLYGGGKRIAYEQPDILQIGFCIEVRGSSPLSGNGQAGKPCLDRRECVRISGLSLKLCPYFLGHFRLLDHGPDAAVMKIRNWSTTGQQVLRQEYSHRSRRQKDRDALHSAR